MLTASQQSVGLCCRVLWLCSWMATLHSSGGEIIQGWHGTGCRVLMPNQWGGVSYWQNANGRRHWSQLGAQVEHHQHRAQAGWGRVRTFVLMEEMERIFQFFCFVFYFVFCFVFFWMGWNKCRDPNALSLCSLALCLDGRGILKVNFSIFNLIFRFRQCF